MQQETPQKLITTVPLKKTMKYFFSDEKNRGKIQSMESSELTLNPDKTFEFSRKRGSWDVTKIMNWEMQIQEGLYMTYYGTYKMECQQAMGELTFDENLDVDFPRNTSLFTFPVVGDHK